MSFFPSASSNLACNQSEVAFAFCHLLGFQLLPRLKATSRQRLYLPLKEMAGDFPNLQPVLIRPIRWHLIEQQYDEMIKSGDVVEAVTAATLNSAEILHLQ